MNRKLFAELVESMTQMKEIVRGERAPSRERCIEPPTIKVGEATRYPKTAVPRPEEPS